jgi:gliding motility-associated protein GldM
MAGGKLTPRQKMINLMYLVFIAMLALNMSKEVLSAFGLMNEKFEDVNEFSTKYNATLFGQIKDKATENEKQYGPILEKAKIVEPVTAKFYKYLGSLKNDISAEFEKEKVNGKMQLPYEAMDKGGYIDEHWFAGDGYSAKGKEIANTIEKYKKDLIAVFGKDVKYQPIINNINSRFDLSDVKDGEGVKKKYLDYHFKGFPAIASLTKLSAMQNDVKKMEQDIYNALIGNTQAQALSMDNYKAIVITDKNAFFQGEEVTGKIVLGRYDDKTEPTRVEIKGGTYEMDNGQALFKINAGSVGEHKIEGQFVFLEDGVEKPIDIEGNYAVVPRPNEATISADKMNSVYRGVDNPMTISFAGISDSDVTATAPGLKKATGTGKYNWNVTTVSGTEATVTVTGKLPDGKAVTSKKVFKVRDIPAPTASIRGKLNSSKGRAQDLAISTVNVEFPGFVYDVDVEVVSFELYVPGQPGMIVQGSKFDGKAQAAINRAKRGDQIQIMAIKTKLKGGGSYRMQDSSPFIWEVQ